VLIRPHFYTLYLPSTALLPPSSARTFFRYVSPVRCSSLLFAQITVRDRKLTCSSTAITPATPGELTMRHARRRRRSWRRRLAGEGSANQVLLQPMGHLERFRRSLYVLILLSGLLQSCSLTWAISSLTPFRQSPWELSEVPFGTASREHVTLPAVTSC